MTREEAAIKSCEDRIKHLKSAPTHHYGKRQRERAIELEKVKIKALRPVSREQVEKVWRGVWKHYLPPLGAGNIQCRCKKCGRTPDVETPFCAWCGAPMTDEAVEMVMERLEALYGEGDRVVCMVSGVRGVITKIYTPTASAMQIMVCTDDGRLYHAPYSTWRLEEVKDGKGD